MDSFSRVLIRGVQTEYNWIFSHSAVDPGLCSGGCLSMPQIHEDVVVILIAGDPEINPDFVDLASAAVVRKKEREKRNAGENQRRASTYGPFKTAVYELVAGKRSTFCQPRMPLATCTRVRNIIRRPCFFLLRFQPLPLLPPPLSRPPPPPPSHRSAAAVAAVAAAAAVLLC